jgi:hypothetical protein
MQRQIEQMFREPKEKTGMLRIPTSLSSGVVLVAMIAGFVCASAAVSQDMNAGSTAEPPTQERQQEQAEPTMIRTYHVADLMRAVGDYPLDSDIVPPAGYGGGALMGGTFFDATSQRELDRSQIDPLTQLIMDLLAQGSWREQGGAVGHMRHFASRLVIAQTRENHARIQQLLDEIRQSGGLSQTVSVRATWVRAGGADAPAPGSQVTAEWLAGQSIYCRGQTVSFSGQVVHIASGRGRAIVSDLTAIVADSAVAFDPEVQRVQSGVSLQVSAQLVPGSELAVLDVQYYLSEWDEPGAAIGPVGIAADQEAHHAGLIDRINMLSQQLKTTLRVPLGQPVVVGGMTLDPAAGKDGAEQILLVVETNALK